MSNHKRYGIFIGRFQPFHFGHLESLRAIQDDLISRSSCIEESKLFIVIGYAEYLDSRHFWPQNTIRQIVKDSIKSLRIEIEIVQIQDINNKDMYCYHVLNMLKINKDVGNKEIIIYSGNQNTLDCFNFSYITQIKLREDHKFTIHSTDLRVMFAGVKAAIIPNTYEWRKYMPESSYSLSEGILKDKGISTTSDITFSETVK